MSGEASRRTRQLTARSGAVGGAGAPGPSTANEPAAKSDTSWARRQAFPQREPASESKISISPSGIYDWPYRAACATLLPHVQAFVAAKGQHFH